MTSISILDTSQPELVAEYERAFFQSFKPLTGNQLIRKLWLWDESAERLKTRVPYQEQTIFVRRDAAGTMDMALAVGTKLDTIQSAFYDFEVPQNDAHCEALAFFGSGESHLYQSVRFWKACREILIPRGYRAIYGTCSPRLITLYRFVGGVVLEKREIENETRFFFHIPLAKRSPRALASTVEIDRTPCRPQNALAQETQ